MMTDGLGESQYEIKRYVENILDMEENKGKYIRFDYPIKDWFGIKKDLTLLKAVGKEVKVNECDNLSLLGKIEELLRLGKYRLCEGWRLLSDMEFFREGNYDIYTPSELLYEYEENEVIKEIFLSIFESLPNEKHLIEYCWFDYNEGMIISPIMIWHDCVRVNIKSNVDAYEIFEWFRESKCQVPFSSIEDIRRDDNGKPGYIEFKLADGIVDDFRDAVCDGLLRFPIKVDKIG